MEICYEGHGRFYGKSVVPNCLAPEFLRTKGWKVYHSAPGCQFDNAPDLNYSLPTSPPEFSVPLSNKRSTPIVLGNWYEDEIFVLQDNSSNIGRRFIPKGITLMVGIL